MTQVEAGTTPSQSSARKRRLENVLTGTKTFARELGDKIRRKSKSPVVGCLAAGGALAVICGGGIGATAVFLGGQADNGRSDAADRPVVSPDRRTRAPLITPSPERTAGPVSPSPSSSTGAPEGGITVPPDVDPKPGQKEKEPEYPFALFQQVIIDDWLWNVTQKTSGEQKLNEYTTFYRTALNLYAMGAAESPQFGTKKPVLSVNAHAYLDYAVTHPQESPEYAAIAGDIQKLMQTNRTVEEVVQDSKKQRLMQRILDAVQHAFDEFNDGEATFPSEKKEDSLRRYVYTPEQGLRPVQSNFILAA